MTHNQIENSKLRETERANRETEALKKQENKIKAVDVANKGATSAIKGVAAAGLFNDVSWYKNSPQLLKDTASISFQQAAAILKEDGLTLKGLNSHKVTKTNVLRLGFMPVLGKGTGPHDNLTVAARSIFTYTRHLNSGHTNYEAPDIGMMVGAVDSIYCGLAWMQRVYKTARYYNEFNRDVPNALLTAMGVSPDDVYANIAQLRGYINKQILKLSTIFVPKTLPIFKRHIWMCDNVFRDSNIKKSSYYLFSPTYLLKYDAANGKLVKQGWFGANAGVSVASIISAFDNLVDSVYGDEDFNIIMGDMLKAYGEANRFKLTEIPESLILEPVYSEEVLSQIENYRCYGAVDSNDIIEQRLDPILNESYLYCNPILDILTGSTEESYTNDLHRSLYVNMHKGNVTPEDVVVATRMTVGLIMDGSDYLLSDFGTEIPTVMDLISYGINWNSSTQQYSTKLLYAYRFTTFGAALNIYDGGSYVALMDDSNTDLSILEGESVINAVSTATILHYFDWAPLYIIRCSAWNTNPGGYSYPEYSIYNDFWDYDNYAVVAYDVLANIHEMCVLSELNVPANR